MEKLLFFALIGALTLSSCGGDDDSIVGTWILSSVEVTGCDDPNFNSTLQSSGGVECTATSPDDCSYSEFTFTETTYSIFTQYTFDGMLDTDSESGTITFDGNQFTECFGGECYTSTFVISGDMMTLSAVDPDDGCNYIEVLKRK